MMLFNCIKYPNKKVIVFYFRFFLGLITKTIANIKHNNYQYK